MKFVITVMVLSLTSCAGITGKRKLSFPKKALVETMLSNGQYEAAARELEGAEIDSFWGNKLLEKSTHQKGVTVLGYSEKHKPICEAGLVKNILDSGASPSGTTVFNLTVAPCPELARQAISVASKQAAEDGAKKALDFVQQVITRQNQLASEELSAAEKNHLELLQETVPSLERLKAKVSGQSSGLARAIESIGGLAGKRSFYASSEGKDSLAMSAVCSKYREKSRLEALIADERAKGQVSGYVNAYKLKTWGDELHTTVVELNNALGSYRKVTGKKFSNFNGCH